MLTLRFTETGKEFQVSYELLRQLARDLPETENYGELALALVDLGLPSLTVHLLGHEAVRPRHDALWEGGDRGIRQALVQESAFLQRLTDKQAQDIIAMDDRKILTSLADNMHVVLAEYEADARRLSRRMSDKLLRFLRKHEDPRIKEAIAKLFNPPKQLCLPFAECLRLGIHPSNAGTMGTMRIADVEQLRTASYLVLEGVAYLAEIVSDAATQKALLHLLTTHPDPAVRLALAKNREAPCEALEALCADADADVARAARKSLDGEEEEEEEEEEDNWED